MINRRESLWEMIKRPKYAHRIQSIEIHALCSSSIKMISLQHFFWFENVHNYSRFVSPIAADAVLIFSHQKCRYLNGDYYKIKRIHCMLLLLCWFSHIFCFCCCCLHSIYFRMVVLISKLWSAIKQEIMDRID